MLVIGKAVGMCADEHVSDMRALRDVRTSVDIPSVSDVDKAVGVPIDDGGTIP
jgi:hypothetical protein